MTNDTDTVAARILTCPQCGEPVALELDEGLEAGGAGIETCSRGHQLVYQYGGDRVEILGVVPG